MSAPGGWERWVEGADWSDWRSWLQHVASIDWASGQLPQVPWRRASGTDAVSMMLRAFEEESPGDRIQEHLAATWPAFWRWWRSGPNIRPTAGEARARLEEHMPELVPTWQQLTELVADDIDAPAALSLWIRRHF